MRPSSAGHGHPQGASTPCRRVTAGDSVYSSEEGVRAGVAGFRWAPQQSLAHVPSAGRRGTWGFSPLVVLPCRPWLAAQMHPGAAPRNVPTVWGALVLHARRLRPRKGGGGHHTCSEGPDVKLLEHLPGILGASVAQGLCRERSREAAACGGTGLRRGPVEASEVCGGQCSEKRPRKVSQWEGQRDQSLAARAPERWQRLWWL